MYAIINEPDYIAVTFADDISFSTLLEAFLSVAALPDYQYKNRLWVFRTSDDTTLSLSTIAAVISILLGVDPKNRKRNKVAIVLQNGFQSNAATLFAREAKKASCRMDLFGNVDSAVQWVSG